MKTIPLTQNKFSQVDDEDFDELSKYKWHYLEGYALRNEYNNGNRKYVRMHREIICAPDELEVDHKDGNGLNNQRSNLRICTSSQNKMNRAPHKDNSSGFKGVWKERRRWYSQIYFEGQYIFIGSFLTPEEAARAYDEAAKKYHGEFAKLNFND